MKLLPERTEGGAIFGFELWSMAKIWRFAAPSEEERRVWVKLLQKQIRFLLASFKQRGKSLAFLPQNVTVLREQLDSMQQQRAEIEEQVQRVARVGLCGRDSHRLGVGLGVGVVAWKRAVANAQASAAFSIQALLWITLCVFVHSSEAFVFV